jgi:hypothetical protein
MIVIFGPRKAIIFFKYTILTAFIGTEIGYTHKKFDKHGKFFNATTACYNALIIVQVTTKNIIKNYSLDREAEWVVVMRLI